MMSLSFVIFWCSFGFNTHCRFGAEISYIQPMFSYEMNFIWSYVAFLVCWLQMTGKWHVRIKSSCSHFPTISTKLDGYWILISKFAFYPSSYFKETAEGTLICWTLDSFAIFPIIFCLVKKTNYRVSFFDLWMNDIYKMFLFISSHHFRF